MGNSCPSQVAQPLGGKPKLMILISDRKGSDIRSCSSSYGGAVMQDTHVSVLPLMISTPFPDGFWLATKAPAVVPSVGDGESPVILNVPKVSCLRRPMPPAPLLPVLLL